MTEKTSLEAITTMIAKRRQVDVMMDWEIDILLNDELDDLMKIASLHKTLETRIQDLVDYDASNDVLGDFLSTLEYAMERGLTLPDIYEF